MSPKLPSFVTVPCNPLKIKCVIVFFFFDGRSSVHYDNTVSTSIIRRVPVVSIFLSFFFCFVLLSFFLHRSDEFTYA